VTDRLTTRPGKNAVAIRPVLAKDLTKTLKALPANDAAWAKANGFKAHAGQILALPRAKGEVGGYLFGLGKGVEPFAAATLAEKLPSGTYWLTGPIPPATEVETAFAWQIGGYRFDRYKKKKAARAKLVVSSPEVAEEAGRLAGAVNLVRDLVNTPANDMGPDELEAAARDLAGAYGAKIKVVKGSALESDFPLIHAVGRASVRSPRLIDMTWGRSAAPKVTLVGKGVCFDTGGLNLKPGNFMALMKKDMGGSANVLGLAKMIMDAGLDVRLRVLIPAVENSVDGNAFRPGDVLQSHKGLTVEIGNTDAEGRLVLADALALGDKDEPDLMVDLATLTGAARVALGAELPAFFTDDDDFAGAVTAAGTDNHDPVWRMPLWQGYMRDIDSKIADINHISQGAYGGSITAALFLSRFVEKAKTYAHLDIFAWNDKARPGKPVGAEACSIRALYHVLKDRYGVVEEPAAKPQPKVKAKRKSAKRRKS
jgi:leucyl aminopeptidase